MPQLFIRSTTVDLFTLTDANGDMDSLSIAAALTRRLDASKYSDGGYSLTLERIGIGEVQVYLHREGEKDGKIVVLWYTITDAVYKDGTVESFSTQFNDVNHYLILPNEDEIIADVLFNDLDRKITINPASQSSI